MGMQLLAMVEHDSCMLCAITWQADPRVTPHGLTVRPVYMGKAPDVM